MINSLHLIVKKCLFVLLFTGLTNCNIWDSIFSHLASPQLTIPDESKVELYNEDKKIMEILVSVKKNALKMSLIDEEVTKLLANTTSVADVYVNFTNGTINMDFSDSCVYKNFSLLQKFNIKFFLASYDLLTFFNVGDEFYEYFLTNPLSSKQNKESKEKYQLRADNLRFLNQEGDESKNIDVKNYINNVDKKKAINYFTQLFETKGLIDQESSMIFRVNKTTFNLEQISIKYNNVQLPNFFTISAKVDKFDDDQFQIKHHCDLFVVDDEDN